MATKPLKILITLLAFSLSDAVDAGCEKSFLEPTNILRLTKLIARAKFSKWNSNTPTEEDMANIIQFWCMEP